MDANQPDKTTRVQMSATYPVNNPSTESVRAFSTLSSRNLKANVLLNSDDYAVPIHKKNPAALLKAIDDNLNQTAKEWGCSKQEVEAMLGSSSKINEPVCGIVANNLMKLFLDTDHFNYDFSQGHSLSLQQLQETLSRLPTSKHFVLRVNDGGLGHAYVIDLPVNTKPDRDAFLYQSDLGDGATRPLRLEDWMNQKASHPLPLSEINRHFNNISHGLLDTALIAKIFDIDGNPNMLRPQRLDLNANRNFNFQLAEYTRENLEKNVMAITEHCK